MAPGSPTGEAATGLPTDQRCCHSGQVDARLPCGHVLCGGGRWESARRRASSRVPRGRSTTRPTRPPRPHPLALPGFPCSGCSTALPASSLRPASSPRSGWIRRADSSSAAEAERHHADPVARTVAVVVAHELALWAGPRRGQEIQRGTPPIPGTARPGSSPEPYRRWDDRASSCLRLRVSAGGPPCKAGFGRDLWRA